jgi:hypothetical protein
VETSPRAFWRCASIASWRNSLRMGGGRRLRWVLKQHDYAGRRGARSTCGRGATHPSALRGPCAGYPRRGSVAQDRARGEGGARSEGTRRWRSATGGRRALPTRGRLGRGRGPQADGGTPGRRAAAGFYSTVTPAGPAVSSPITVACSKPSEWNCRSTSPTASETD